MSEPGEFKTRPRVRKALVATLAALGYYAGARLGYRFAIPGGAVMLWPASGVMLGLMLSSERRDWPAILVGGLIGSVVSDTRSGYGVVFAAGAAVANVGETLAATLLVTSRLRHRITLSSLRDVGVLVFGAVILSNAATAILGAIAMHQRFQSALLHAWFFWWIGDGLGMLIVAPVVITGVLAARHPRFRTRSAVEAVLVFAALAVISQITLGPGYSWATGSGPFATFPLLLWAGLRFGPFGAAAATLVVAAIATWNAALHLGPFAGSSLSVIDTAVQTYTYLAVTSLCALIPAAVVAEREASARRQSESEDRYRSVVEAATDAIVTIDTDSRVRFANAAVMDIFGYAPDELIGHNLDMLMPESFRPLHKAGLHRYVTTGAPTLDWRAKRLTGLHRDGHEIPLEISFGVRNEGDARIFTGIIRDISDQQTAARALREAEDRMGFALAASRVGTWEVDVATGASTWSTIQEELHGVAAGTYGGTLEAFIDRIHPDDRQQVRAAIQKAMQQRTDSNLLYRTVWPDGSVHWISGVGRSFYNADGTPIRAAGIALDVTERRALEEQYRQSQKMEAVGQLAGGVAHDFNNLLTVIQSYGSILRDNMKPNSEAAHNIAEVLSAADRAAALTRRLLAFSRGQLLAPRALSLSESLLSVEPMLRRLIGEHVEIVVRAPRDGGNVVADPSEIEQVILNLAINARDAMPDGGALTLEISNVELDSAYRRIHGTAATGPYVMLSVSDTGTGMDAATAARVFEPFFTTKPPGKGTGLGLSTVYGIVTRNGGSIAVYSEPNHGTTFRAYFPRSDAEMEAVAPTATTSATAGSETLLLVEDDPAIRRITTRILTAAGYRVIPAGSPEEALDIADTNATDIDLLFTDVVLPEMSGRGLAEKLSARVPAMKVLYMSGYTDDIVVRAGVLEHDTLFLQKPFSQSALLSKVREALDRSSARS
ncbi:MAG: PAS domain S-box protein [Gemmatimonadota bacterium]